MDSNAFTLYAVRCLIMAYAAIRTIVTATLITIASHHSQHPTLKA